MSGPKFPALALAAIALATSIDLPRADPYHEGLMNRFRKFHPGATKNRREIMGPFLSLSKNQQRKVKSARLTLAELEEREKAAEERRAKVKQSAFGSFA